MELRVVLMDKEKKKENKIISSDSGKFKILTEKPSIAVVYTIPSAKLASFWNNWTTM